MKNKLRTHSIGLAAIALVLFLILVSSTASVATAQNDSSVKTYAYVTNYASSNVSMESYAY